MLRNSATFYDFILNFMTPTKDFFIASVKVSAEVFSSLFTSDIDIVWSQEKALYQQYWNTLQIQKHKINILATTIMYSKELSFP